MKNHLNLLKQEVWKKAIGTDQIVDEDHYFRHIASKISNSEEVEISRIKNADSIHWETVKGFFKNEAKSRKDTLDIFSWYVIGGDEVKTFENFKVYKEEKQDKPPKRLPTKRIARVFFGGGNISRDHWDNPLLEKGPL